MKSALHMVVTLVAVGLIASGSLALVNGWAAPLIAANEAKVKMAAVTEVVPGGATSKPVDEVVPAAGDADGGAPLEAYLVLDSAGEVKGWAVVGVGTGFADKITLMVGLTPALDRTLGLKVLKDAETPGLGTKIREGRFPDQFFGRGGTAPSLTNGTLVVVKGAPGAPNEVQAITGATISSKAVVRIVDAGVARLRARVASHGAAAPAAPAAGAGSREVAR